MIKVSHVADTLPPCYPQESNNENAAHQIIKLNHSNHIKTLKTSKDSASFCRKFSTKFILIFGMVAVTTIVICSILIAIMTAKFFINSKMYDLERGLMMQRENLLLNGREKHSRPQQLNNKTERNSFNNWMQSNFGQNIFGFNSDHFLQNSFFPGNVYRHQ